RAHQSGKAAGRDRGLAAAARRRLPPVVPARPARADVRERLRVRARRRHRPLAGRRIRPHPAPFGRRPMTSGIADALQAFAPLSAGAAACALAFVALALVRCLGQEPRSRAPGLGVLAKANERWLKLPWLERIDAWLSMAGRPRDLSAGEWIALCQTGAAAGLA